MKAGQLKQPHSDLLGGSFDFIIVGGGTAGCVLANRLSANPSQRVVLIEAGADRSTPQFPEYITDPSVRTVFASSLYWPDGFGEAVAPKNDEGAGRLGPVMLVRSLGGGSIVNGMHAVRGLPRDYDEWSGLGVEGWGSADVLPYFKKVEKDLDFNGPYHGDAGPVVIQRIPDVSWSGLSLALREALEAQGLARAVDFNDPGVGDGVGPVPLNFGPQGRMSTTTAYLTPDVRRRSNLRILTDVQVARISFEGRRAVGVECAEGSWARAIRGSNVILCAGAINSPALLQRSGIGSTASLKQWGISTVRDLPGVGQNLLTHALLSINAHLRPSGRRTSVIGPPCPMIIRFSSNTEGCAPTDMFINVWERLLGSHKQDPLGLQIADLMFQLNKSYSRGDVHINPTSPLAMPRVRFNLLGDPRDRRRVVDGAQFILDLLRHPSVADLVNEVFVTKLTPMNLKMREPTKTAAALCAIASLVIRGPASIRQRFLRDSTVSLGGVDRAKLEQIVDENVMAAAHSVGTCRMGALSDPQAVTDSRCRVIGIEGLRVIDGSIFPTIMTAGTNLPIMMAAEKAADMIISDSRQVTKTEATSSLAN